MTKVLSAPSLFELYNDEKADMEDSLTAFPSFKVWKKQYLQERTTEMETVVVDDVETHELPAEFQMEEDNDLPKTKAKPVITKPTQKKKGLSNMDKAKIIYKDMISDTGELPERRNVIEAFMSKLKISKACASTYSHNIKQAFL